MKVENMKSSRGNIVANQFIITDGNTIVFQSYSSSIVKICIEDGKSKTYLDSQYWDYSVTTGRYRNQFLGEGIGITRKKIASGEYELVNLNAA